MERLHVAFAFGRADVDAFLGELDIDQLDEWIAYDHLNPSGWRALNMATARIAWATFQSRSSKEIPEQKLMIRLASEGPRTIQNKPATDMVRMEAFSVRTEIQARLAEEKAKISKRPRNLRQPHRTRRA